MFYESFIPDPANQQPWVRDSASLPYIKSAGNTIRSVLETHMPSSLTNPQPAPAAPTEPPPPG
jgi:hypothetical protein